jgi:hypothetical protein
VIDQPPPRRPDVPCETQELPDFHAPKAIVATTPGGGLLPNTGLPISLPKFKAAPLMEAGKLMKQIEAKRQLRENAAAKQASAKKASR